MDGRSPKHRRALLQRLSGARTELEIAEAEREASFYLKQCPDDTDVAVAAEKLDERAAKLRDPEREANRWSVAIFVGAAALIALALSSAVGDWRFAVLTGVLVAGMVAEVVWEALKDRAEHKEERRDDVDAR